MQKEYSMLCQIYFQFLEDYIGYWESLLEFEEVYQNALQPCIWTFSHWQFKAKMPKMVELIFETKCVNFYLSPWHYYYLIEAQSQGVFGSSKAL